MSRLEELIEELCPDGVEYKTVGEVCNTITDYTAAGSFADIAKNVKYINCGLGYAQLVRTTDLKSSFSKPDSFVYVDEHAFKYLWRVDLDCEGLVMPNVGNCGEVYYVTPSVFPYKNNVLGPNAILVKSKTVNTRYLYHLFLERKFQLALARITSSTGQTKFNKTNFKTLSIPIPPLPVQEEIVRILDKFTSLTAELQAELQARKKQYDYYRDTLIYNKDFQYKCVDELCEVSAGGDAPKYAMSKEKTEEYTIPIISNGIGENALYGYTNTSKINDNAVTVAARGTIGYAEYRDYPYYPIIRLLTLIPKEKNKLDAKYLYYCLQGKQYKVPTTGIPQLTAPMVKQVEIPIPDINKQKEIVQILDNFNNICTSISDGIPAEIEARQKQYEYYRDKLLSFKEAMPNEETLEAFAEGDAMLENNTGQTFTNAADVFAALDS